jgi:hypothetical protein
MALAILLHTAYDGVIVWAVVGASAIAYLALIVIGLVWRKQ